MGNASARALSELCRSCLGSVSVRFAYEKLEEIAKGNDLELAAIARDALKRLNR